MEDKRIKGSTAVNKFLQCDGSEKAQTGIYPYAEFTPERQELQRAASFRSMSTPAGGEDWARPKLFGRRMTSSNGSTYKCGCVTLETSGGKWRAKLDGIYNMVSAWSETPNQAVDNLRHRFRDGLSLLREYGYGDRKDA